MTPTPMPPIETMASHGLQMFALLLTVFCLGVIVGVISQHIGLFKSR
jgi:hypothetical protein